MINRIRTTEWKKKILESNKSRLGILANVLNKKESQFGTIIDYKNDARRCFLPHVISLFEYRISPKIQNRKYEPLLLPGILV